MARHPMPGKQPTTTPLPAFAVGATLWFTKSMRMVRVTTIHPYDRTTGWTYTVARVDSGKELLATESALAPLDEPERS